MQSCLNNSVNSLMNAICESGAS